MSRNVEGDAACPAGLPAGCAMSPETVSALGLGSSPFSLPAMRPLPTLLVEIGFLTISSWVLLNGVNTGRGSIVQVFDHVR